MISQDLLTLLIWGWMAIAVGTFVILQFVSAPYGRHTRPGWGPTISNRLGWIIMEAPGLILMPALFLAGPATKTPVHWLLLGLYLCHYLNRCLIFPLRMRTQGKRMPVAIMGSAIFFNLMNTSIMGSWLGWYATYTIDWLWSPQCIAGVVLFALGLGFNIDSDNRLLRLRKPGETGYKIPQGGLFRYISCPNLFSEIVEWIGYALIGWNVAMLSFAVWTFANLAPRAMDHHRWYLGKFEDYPKERKGLVPFLW
jgi:3-oxo-5-alpha-steroid 4-dehydrogenase 1